jgi:hypothetical protein
MQRLLEPESMDSLEEVIAYEKIVNRLGFWMEDPIVRTLSKLIKRLNKTDYKILDVGGVQVGSLLNWRLRYQYVKYI